MSNAFTFRADKLPASRWRRHVNGQEGNTTGHCTLTSVCKQSNSSPKRPLEQKDAGDNFDGGSRWPGRGDTMKKGATLTGL